MANESSYASISSLIGTIYEGAVLTARENSIMAPLVSSFSDLNSAAVRGLAAYSGGTIQTLWETQDLSAQTFTPASLATLTPYMYGAQYFLTDRRVRSDPFGVQRDAARDLGEMVATAVDTALVGLLDDFTGGTVGTAGGTITWANFFNALGLLRRAKAPQPYVCVLEPGQWYFLANTIAAGATVTNAPALQDAVARQFFAANAYGVDVYVDANITSGTAAKGGMFAREAIALDTRQAFRIEPQRDGSRGGGGWELNSSIDYASGVWRAAFGVTMVGTSVMA
jgi:hypothetical protein